MVGESTSGTVSGDVGPISEITTQQGTTPSLSSPSITLSDDHDAVIIFTGNLPLTTAWLTLTCNIEGTTKTIIAVRDAAYILNASAGDRIAIAATTRTGSSQTETNTAATLQVVPFATPGSLTAPSGATGTINTDKNGPPYWEPSVPHIVLPSENSAFQIDSASGIRNVFVSERDGQGVWTYPRWIRVPDSQAVYVRCHYPVVAISMYHGGTMAITAPTGSVISTRAAIAYSPDTSAFTGTTRAVTASDNGFGVDAGTLTQNFASCLAHASLEDGDIITIEAGTISLTGSDIINTANYSSTALAKSLWIKSATGDPADVTFDTNTMQLSVASGKQWLFDSVTIDMGGAGTVDPTASGTAIMAVTGHVHMHDCVLRGLTNTESDAGYQITASSGNNLEVILSYNTFGLTRGDSVQGFGETGTCLIHCIGNIYNGNNSLMQHQVLTTHNSANNIIDDWGGKINDTEKTDNLTRVAADTAGSIYCMYTQTAAADITYGDGVSFAGMRGMFGCAILACSRATPRNGYIIGCDLRQKAEVTATTFINAIEGTGEWVGRNVLMGCRFIADNINLCHAFNGHTWVEAIGCYFESNGAANANACDIGPTNPASAVEVSLVNCRFNAAGGASKLVIGTAANVTAFFTNCILEGTTADGYTVGASGGEMQAQYTYLRRNPASLPTNWATRFPNVGTGLTDDGNTWSTSAPGLESDGTPTASGNCDDEGFDLGSFGGLDSWGRSLWLGGEFVRGSVNRPAIISLASLFPSQWW